MSKEVNEINQAQPKIIEANQAQLKQLEVLVNDSIVLQNSMRSEDQRIYGTYTEWGRNCAPIIKIMQPNGDEKTFVTKLVYDNQTTATEIGVERVKHFAKQIIAGKEDITQTQRISGAVNTIINYGNLDGYLDFASTAIRHMLLPQEELGQVYRQLAEQDRKYFKPKLDTTLNVMPLVRNEHTIIRHPLANSTVSEGITEHIIECKLSGLQVIAGDMTVVGYQNPKEGCLASVKLGIQIIDQKFGPPIVQTRFCELEINDPLAEKFLDTAYFNNILKMEAEQIVRPLGTLCRDIKDTSNQDQRFANLALNLSKFLPVLELELQKAFKSGQSFQAVKQNGLGLLADKAIALLRCLRNPEISENKKFQEIAAYKAYLASVLNSKTMLDAATKNHIRLIKDELVKLEVSEVMRPMENVQQVLESKPQYRGLSRPVQQFSELMQNAVESELQQNKSVADVKGSNLNTLINKTATFVSDLTSNKQDDIERQRSIGQYQSEMVVLAKTRGKVAQVINAIAGVAGGIVRRILAKKPAKASTQNLHSVLADIGRHAEVVASKKSAVPTHQEWIKRSAVKLRSRANDNIVHIDAMIKQLEEYDAYLEHYSSSTHDIDRKKNWGAPEAFLGNLKADLKNIKISEENLQEIVGIMQKEQMEGAEFNALLAKQKQGKLHEVFEARLPREIATIFVQEKRNTLLKELSNGLNEWLLSNKNNPRHNALLDLEATVNQRLAELEPAAGSSFSRH